MKTHFVTRFTHPGDDVSFYRNGQFLDFCHGPHVPSTGRVKAVKVLSIAGAYWLGDEKKPPAPARLRHRLLLPKGDGRPLRTPRRSRQARSPPPRQATRPLQHSGSRRRWPHLLASQRRHDPQNHGRLDERRVPPPRLQSRLHPPRHEARTLAEVRPRGLLRRQHVHPHGARRCRVPPQAHELPRPHPHL